MGLDSRRKSMSHINKAFVGILNEFRWHLLMIISRRSFHATLFPIIISEYRSSIIT